MGILSEPIIDWHAGKLAEHLNVGLRKSMKFDGVKHAAKYPCGILYRLGLAEVAAAWAHISDMSALIMGGDFKAAAGASGILLEYQCNIFARKLWALKATALGGFELLRKLEQMMQLCRRKIIKGKNAAAMEVCGHVILILIRLRRGRSGSSYNGYRLGRGRARYPTW